MTSGDLVKILSSVPEKKLKLIPLVWELVGEDGEIDPEQAVFHSAELGLALEEAQVLRSANQNMLMELIRYCRDVNDSTL